MQQRTAFLFALLWAGTLIGQDQKPKWDVSAPEGMTFVEHRFEVKEGTWMNLDVSPDGKTIAFDLLGDIYTLPVTGGTATCIRSGLPWEVQPRFSPDGARILFTSDAGGGDNIWVMDADGNGARQITKESFRLLNNATWMPDGQHVVARKHFTNTRSLGAGELWVYHIGGGDGLQLTKRKNDQQDVNEPSVSPEGRYVYFSEDMYGGGFFQYNKDPLKQITAIRRYDRQEGKTEDITGGSGGACRPQISPDGQHLAFVRRVDTKSVLFVRDMRTGLEFPVYDKLDKDQQEAWTIFGVYTGFNWMPVGQMADTQRHIIIWAGGKIRKVSFDPNALDQRDALTSQVRVADIPFTCTVNTRLAQTLRPEQTVYEPRFKARAIRQAVTSPDGRHLVFNAAGHLYKKVLPDGTPERLLPNGVSTYQSGTETWRGALRVLEYEPAFSPDGKKLAFVTWSDQMGGALWVMDFPSGTPRQLRGAGIYRQPAFSPDGKIITYVSANGDDEVGPTLERKPGVYILRTDADAETEAVWITESGEQPRFSADGKRILLGSGGNLFGSLSKELVSYNLQGADKRVLFKSKYATNWTPSPDGQWLAFTELYKTYICAMPDFGQTVDLGADSKSVPLTQVSRDAGYNLHWSADSKRLFYTLGEAYYAIDLNQRFTFLPGAPDSLPPLPEKGTDIGLTLEYDTPQGVIALTNARIITCEGGSVIENGTIEVTRNKITYLGKASGYRKPPQAIEVDCKGKTIMPGIVDVHSHSGNFRNGLNPEKQWEYFANLAYGVTTMHDPSVNSEMAFSNAEMLKAGEMTGPRLFSTGTILYGADGDFKAPVNSLEDARSALRRTKAWGAISVKSYNQPRRDQRQQVMAAAKELDMLVVPEGGSFFYHNLTQVADGHTGVEHNLPVATVYDDVIQFWKRTTAHNTPTLIVCYGAVNGEYYFFQKEDIWKKQPLRHFTPGHVLDQRARHRTMIPDEEYENGHILVSKSLKKMQENGININLGSHGQLQGLGAHWELWMLQQGGMSNLQAIQCATINGARYLGMDKEIGSLKTGKLADLVILDANPLENIRHTERVRQVMVNGRLYDAATLRETGHYNKPAGPFWFHQPGRSGGHSGMTHSCQEAKCVCGH